MVIVIGIGIIIVGMVIMMIIGSSTGMAMVIGSNRH